MAQKKKIAKSIAEHLKNTAGDSVAGNSVYPDFKSLITGGKGTSLSNACTIVVSLKLGDGMPEIGRAAKLKDVTGGEYYLTFSGSDASAKTAPGVYTLEWMATGIPATKFSLDVTGDISAETHRPFRIPASSYTGGVPEITAVAP